MEILFHQVSEEDLVISAMFFIQNQIASFIRVRYVDRTTSEGRLDHVTTTIRFLESGGRMTYYFGHKYTDSDI